MVVVEMKMPKCCDDCPCLDDYGDYPRCRISNEQRGYNFPIHEKRMPECPIKDEVQPYENYLPNLFYA